jgi:S-adenosylmethionine synthetase
LLIELCFRHFRGELKPKTQADIGRAMQDWITERGYEAADSTIRIRTRKVWNAIKRDDAGN